MEPYGLPNRIMSELSAKIFSSPNLLKYIYYTDKEHANVDIFELETPKVSELINKNICIGRRIPKIMERVGAFLDIRVNRYEPRLSQRSAKIIKDVEIDIDIICHEACQTTLRGTRDITIVTLLQEALENELLTGIGEVEIYSTTEILGLHEDFSGYQLRVKVTGFNRGLYETD